MPRQPASSPTITGEQDENKESCRHHWVIQPASGPVSLGECQFCWEAREFKNYVESTYWGDSRLTT